MRTTTSKSDFQKFQRYCKKELTRHRLGDWIVSYEQGDCGTDLSCVIYSLKERIATIKLNDEWECGITDRNLKEVALHEVLHLAVAKLLELAESRYNVTQEALSEAEHDVIDRIIFSRFGDTYDASNARTEVEVDERK